MPVYFHQFASRIVKINHGIIRAATVLGVVDSVTHFHVPQPTEWQRITDQSERELKQKKAKRPLKIAWLTLPKALL